MRKNTWLETVTAVTFLIFVGVIVYYSFYPFKVTTLNSIGINAAEYCRGDWVEIELNFVKHMDIEAKIDWFIVDGIVYELDSPGISRPAGQNNVIISKQVPFSILPGKYNMRVVSTYKVHPLHKEIVNTWNTPTFEVKGSADCPPVDEDTSSFPSPVSRPAVQRPTAAPQSAPVAPDSAQPVIQSTTIVTEQKEPQVFSPEPTKTPIKDLLETVIAPVKGLLQ